MCDTYSQNACDNLRIEPNERIVKNSEVDQRWVDWLAPARRSFLFSAGGRCSRAYAWRRSPGRRACSCPFPVLRLLLTNSTGQSTPMFQLIVVSANGVWRH